MISQMNSPASVDSHREWRYPVNNGDAHVMDFSTAKESKGVIGEMFSYNIFDGKNSKEKPNLMLKGQCRRCKHPEKAQLRPNRHGKTHHRKHWIKVQRLHQRKRSKPHRCAPTKKENMKRSWGRRWKYGIANLSKLPNA